MSWLPSSGSTDLFGSFGGNQGHMTVSGYGAGAELAHFLVLSEKAKGLFQQVVLMSSTAMQWVNRYIGSFGGNKQRITVIGYGTGAELCHFLVLSERAKGLFQRVVLMSSTAISFPVDNQIQPNAIQKTKALAEALDCPTSNNEEMISCLREKPSTEFVLHTQNPQFGRAFPVIVDNDILQDSPMNLLKAGKVNDVDLIVGMTSDEDAQQSFRFLPSNLSCCPTTDEIKLIIQQVSLLSFYNPETVSVALSTEYLSKGGFDDICQTRGSFRQFMQDYLSVWSTLETARLHANTEHSVYVYSYDYEPLKHYNSLSPEQAGPSYADDLQFLFGDPYSPLVDELELSYRLRDKQMSHLVFQRSSQSCPRLFQLQVWNR